MGKNRIKYDIVTGKTTDVTADEEAIQRFLQQNKSNPKKVVRMRTIKRGERTSKEKAIKSVGNTVRMNLPVFSNAQRFRSLKSENHEEEQKTLQQKQREVRNAERRKAREARIAAEKERDQQ